MSFFLFSRFLPGFVIASLGLTCLIGCAPSATPTTSQDTAAASQTQDAGEEASPVESRDAVKNPVLGEVSEIAERVVPEELLSGIREHVPRLSRPHSYVGSDACRQCHPSEHSSWHQTYHRTMTQLALPGNVLGEFNDQKIQSAGLEYRVFSKGDEFWAELPDPDRMLDYSRGDHRVDPKQLPLVERRVLMTTGSHHYQTYWVGHGEFETVMNTLPLVYLPSEKKWIPREAAFMAPPDQPFRMITIWNDHCINCHSTGGNPGLAGPKTLLTSVGELGISCEACHGPGENHVAQHAGGTANPESSSRTNLVNPKKLDHERSSQICGQCHGVFVRQGEQGMKFAREGIQFRPGEDLHAVRHYITFPAENASAAEKAALKRNRQFFRERWWDDGTILAGGREYSAMQGVACFTQGEMSCLSCHSMHNAPPDDQLSEGMRGNQACVQCHDDAKYNESISDHTRHAASSAGSNCMNCHMPHTSYALFKAIRNHTISSPNVRNSADHGVPNACNLCHLDQTLEWTQGHLTSWYGHERAALSPEHREVAASVLWLLKGHAAQRAVAAWHYGWLPAQKASSTAWMIPVLCRTLEDPYGVVRHITELSIRSIPSYQDLDFDFLAEESLLRRSVDDLMSKWKATGETLSQSVTPQRVLIRADGTSQTDRIERLLQTRDNRPVTIKE